MTGALFPSAADAVVPVEWTDGGTGQARFSRPVAKGYSIRRIGDDVAEGAVLVPEGTRLGPAQLALLAATGHGSLLARGAPRVAVIATGNELSEPGSPLVPGRIWESNTYMLAAAVRQAGGVATRHRAGDHPGTVLALLEEQSAQADLLVTSGGVSMGGEHDVVKAALSGNGATTADMRFGKVAMQPGMPQGFGVIGRVRPALDALQGQPPRPLPSQRAELTGRVTSPAGRRSFLRGVLAPDGTTVTPLTGQGSHQLGALAQANALIVVPEQVTAMEAGDGADVISLP
jgi:molybdopterin molybdotransferase